MWYSSRMIIKNRGLMKNILVITLAMFVLISCIQKETVQLEERTVLRIGTDATYPPFETVNIESGQPEGFDIDLITEICKVNGWQTEFIVTPFSGIIPGLQNKKYDLVLSAMTITPKRAVVVDFSNPYYLAGQVVAVPLDNNTILSFDDVRGKKVGVQLGTTGELMAKKVDGIEVFSFDNIGSAFLDMQNGNLDAILNDFPTTQAYINRHKSAKTVGEILSSEFYGMAVRKGDKKLLEAVNSALALIKKDGRYQEIHLKWFNTAPLKQFLQLDSADNE